MELLKAAGEKRAQDFVELKFLFLCSEEQLKMLNNS